MDRQAAEWVVRTWAGALGYDVPTHRNESKAKIKGDTLSTSSIKKKKKLTEQQGKRFNFPDISDTDQKEISPKKASEEKKSYTRVSEPVRESSQEYVPSMQKQPEKNTSSPLMILGILGFVGIVAILLFAMGGGFSQSDTISSSSDGYSYSTSYIALTSTPLKKDSDAFYDIDRTQDFLWIESDKERINQGDSIIITIIGLPEHQCYIWIKGTGNMAGTSGNQPPIFTPNQRGLKQDTAGGPYNIGSYQYNGGAGRSIRQDVAIDQAHKGTRSYGLIALDSDGYRSIECTTSTDTKPGTYTIRVERKGYGQYPSDELNIFVK